MHIPFYRMIHQTCRALPRLRFDLSAAQIGDCTKELLKTFRDSLDNIGKLGAAECDFESVIKPLALLEAEFTSEIAKLNFPQYVSVDKEIRDASVEATKQIDQFQIEKGMREDLFKATEAASGKLPKDVDAETKRLVEKMLLEFKLNGLSLNKEDREKLKVLRNQLSELEVEFSKNMNEDKTTLKFTKEELDGCPGSFLDSLEKDGDSYVLTMKYPDVFGVMRNAKNEKTRELMETAFSSRCPQNLPIITEAIKLRHKCALLLGYSDHTEVRLVNKMAQKPENVTKFLTNLRGQLDPLATKELEKLKSLKSKDSPNPFMTFDFGFYNRKLMQEEYAVDHEKIKEYFPLDHVMEEMLKIYQQVLSIKIAQVEGPSWHPEAKLFEVSDFRNGKPIGYMFFDLHPRDGKYTHAACFQLQPGYERADGTRQLPACALVCNFTKATGERPSLLNHDEVVTLFHELGHGMHDMCGKTKYSRFHGTSVEYDFVEAPSQMLENWCWEGEILQKLSKHYKTSAPLPKELIQSLIKTKNVNTGLLNLRQLFFATLDMRIHSAAYQKETEPLDETYAEMRKDIALIEQPVKSNPIASFGHLMGGCKTHIFVNLCFR